MAEPNPHDFLLFLVCSLTDNPDAVSIKEHSDDNGRSTFQIGVDPSDKDTVTGGDIAEALHAAFSAYTYKHRIRASLELLG